MYDRLIAKIAAGTLAGIVTLSLVAGMDRLATQQHAGSVLAQGKTTPALVAASASAPGQRHL